jgi:LacI family transcriptional regulator
MGVRIPDDLSIVGHDDVSFAELTEPPLTTVRVSCEELARLATDILFTLLNDPDAPPEPQVVPTELVIRDSVSAPCTRELSFRESVRLVSKRNGDGQEPAQTLAVL